MQKSLKSEIALTLKLLMLWLSNCRKLLILGCPFTWYKLFIVFLFVYNKNKDTPLWIGSFLCTMLEANVFVFLTDPLSYLEPQAAARPKGFMVLMARLTWAAYPYFLTALVHAIEALVRLSPGTHWQETRVWKWISCQSTDSIRTHCMHISGSLVVIFSFQK